MSGIASKNISSISSRYRPEIDGLRAFAVIAVIVNHFNKDILPGGYLGVDIFFVISGFVITSSLYQRPSKNFKDFISGFYERRIKRLVPALSVFVLIMSIAICLFNPKPMLSLRTGIGSLFGVSNLYLLRQSTDYFAQSTELNVFTHTWSLGVEEQFYILFPFLIWFSGFGCQIKNGARNLFLIVGALTITSLIGFLYLYPINQSAAYFLMPTRFWEMASGSLLFIGFQKRTSIEQFLEKIPPFLVLALIIGVMYLPMSWATASTVAVVALSAVLIASLKKQTTAFKIFTHPKVVYIGLISYSLYLWHWGILSLSRWTIGIQWWTVPFQVALMLGLAIGSYRWIETPLRKGNWLSKRWKTLVVGGGVLVTVSGGLVALQKPLKGTIYLGKESNCIPYQYETCTSADHPHHSVTPFIRGTNIQRNECKSPISHEEMDLCTVVPEVKTSPTIFIAGSSILYHLSPVFEELRNEFKIGISMLTKPGCDLDPLLLYKNSQGTCKNSNKNRISYIKKNAKEGDILFIGVTNSNKFEESSIKKMTEIAHNKNINIVHLTPIPEWQRLNPEVENICEDGSAIQWYRPKGILNCAAYTEINRNIYERKEKHILDFLNLIEKSNSFFHVYPIHDFLCDSSKCPSHIKGIRLYRDNIGHISIPAAQQYLSPEIRSFLLQRKLIEKNNPK
tara:strand:- start:100 stop:2136 length:2037 start_codon:yes stop_codon:yes gene_type:complete